MTNNGLTQVNCRDKLTCQLQAQIFELQNQTMDIIPPSNNEL